MIETLRQWYEAFKLSAKTLLQEFGFFPEGD